MKRRLESQRASTRRRRWKEAASQLRECSKNRLPEPCPAPGVDKGQVYLAIQGQGRSVSPALCSPTSQALCCSHYGMNFHKQPSIKPRGFGEMCVFGFMSLKKNTHYNTIKPTVLEPYLLVPFVFCYCNCKSKST